MEGEASETPQVIDTAVDLHRVVAELSRTAGPTAIDAERAGSYRYSHRAYLIQIKRGTGPAILVDPVAGLDLSSLADAIERAEWVLHAADQDLRCLAEVGLVPRSLFDTELAARILGKSRVGLAGIVKSELGVDLDKAHSAADWSRRPLPHAWLRYAAMDVEHLIDLRSLLHDQLVAAGRAEWAIQEFESVRKRPPAPARTEPWRRTSGIHAIRSPRLLAIVRELWEARDEYAMASDIAPHKVLADSAIIAAALAEPTSETELAGTPGFKGRGAKRGLGRWWGAIRRAQALPSERLPAVRAGGGGIPPPGSWSRAKPDAAIRLGAARTAVRQIHDELGIPPENLLPPRALRTVCWQIPDELTPDAVGAALAAAGARPWQVELCGTLVATAIADPAGQAGFSNADS